MVGVGFAVVAMAVFFAIGIWTFWWLAEGIAGTGAMEERAGKPEAMSREEEEQEERKAA